MQEAISRTEFDRLFSAAYGDLRRLAARVRQREVGQTLNATALVNEVYLKLLPSLRLKAQSSLHFKRIVVRAMRQVLVEAARRRQALKRGGDVHFVTLNEENHPTAVTAAEMIALDEALTALEKLEPRQAELVEHRFFGDLSLAEIAQVLGVSESTVDRDWRAARAWLSREIRRKT